MSSKQERKTGPSTDQEEETASVPDQSSASVEEASSKAAETVDVIDEVLEEFDNLTLAELGLRKDEDPAVINRAIEDKVKGFQQKGGQ